MVLNCLRLGPRGRVSFLIVLGVVTRMQCVGGACACPFLNSAVQINSNQRNGTKFDDYEGLLFADMINRC